MKTTPRAAKKLLFREEPPKNVIWGLHNSPTGMLMIGMTPAHAVCRVAWVPNKKTAAVLKSWQKEWPQTDFTRSDKETAAVAKTVATAGTLPALQMTGTPFQQKVWQGLLAIPAGETISYGTLARRIKNPKAARAVGAACGANPVPIVVPCHRVIANDDGLGGFTSGLAIKKVLLKAESGLKAKKRA